LTMKTLCVDTSGPSRTAEDSAASASSLPAGTPVVKSPHLHTPSVESLPSPGPTVVQLNSTAQTTAEVARREPWDGFPDVDWGFRRLNSDVPDFATVYAIPRRPYGYVSNINKTEFQLRSDYSIVDFGADGAPGWTHGIGPCILRFAYPRPVLPTLLSSRKNPFGLWWYMVQKILPFPEHSQDEAPLLVVPAQLVTETDSELLMWHMAGDDDEPEELMHGLLCRDESLVSAVRQPVLCPHQELPPDALARFHCAWQHSPLVPAVVAGSGAAARIAPGKSTAVPAAAPGFEAIVAIETADEVPHGGAFPEPDDSDQGDGSGAAGDGPTAKQRSCAIS